MADGAVSTAGQLLGSSFSRSLFQASPIDALEMGSPVHDPRRFQRLDLLYLQCNSRVASLRTKPCTFDLPAQANQQLGTEPCHDKCNIAKYHDEELQIAGTNYCALALLEQILDSDRNINKSWLLPEIDCHKSAK